MFVRGAGRPVPRIVHRFADDQVRGIDVIADVRMHCAQPARFSHFLAHHLILGNKHRWNARLAQGSGDADAGAVAEQSDPEARSGREIQHLSHFLQRPTQASRAFDISLRRFRLDMHLAGIKIQGQLFLSAFAGVFPQSRAHLDDGERKMFEAASAFDNRIYSRFPQRRFGEQIRLHPNLRA